MKKEFALATATAVTALFLFVGCGVKVTNLSVQYLLPIQPSKIKELVALGYCVPLLRVFLFTECYFTCYLRDSQLFRLPECAS